MSKWDDDLNNKSDDELKQETYKILEEDVFSEAENLTNKIDLENKNVNEVKNEKKYNNYEYTDYNQYNSKKAEKKDKNKNPFIIFIIIVAAIIIIRCLFMASTLMNVDYDDYELYENEDTYDIEYDIDNDGYLDYREKEQYNTDRSLNYEELITFNEVFVDKHDKTIYFEYENRNELAVNSIELDIIYYDKDGNIVDVGRTYLSGNVLNKKIYGDILYNREYESYDYKFIVNLYDINKNEIQIPNVEVIDYDKEVVNSYFDITLKNNSNKNVSGSIYIIFYNGNKEEKKIVYVTRTSVYDLKPGKKVEENAYINKNILPSYENVEINIDALEIDEY